MISSFHTLTSAKSCSNISFAVASFAMAFRLRLAHLHYLTSCWHQGQVSQSHSTCLGMWTLWSKRRNALPTYCTHPCSNFNPSPNFPQIPIGPQDKVLEGRILLHFITLTPFFADMIWAEIFTHELSNLIPIPSYTFTCFHTSDFLELSRPPDHIPHTSLDPASNYFIQ